MTQNSFQMISSAVSDRGLSEKRPQNEDSYLEMPEKGLFAVADGVGGAQAGDVASQMAMEILAEAFNNFREGGDVEDLMSVAITRANGAIYQMSHELAQLSTMATTLVALQITGNIATIGHVGDSRLYRLDSRGNLFRETQDHSVVEEEVRAGRMTPEQAENHPSKNVISRALGAESSVEIDMKTIMFEANTTFLLCSDGITRHIPDVEIRELLALPHPPVLICQQMQEICYERGAEDNLTAVIIKFGGVSGDAEIEIEENTVATPRQSGSGESFVNNSIEDDEIPTQNLQLPIAFQEPHPESFQPTETAKNLTQATHQGIGEKEQIPATQEISHSIKVESEEPDFGNEIESNNGGFFGKFILFLTGLIFGGLLGAGGYYFWLSSQPKEVIPTIPQMESKNIPYTTFEDNRRSVDKNPLQWVKTSGATANDAEGYYLLGRAYLLSAEYPKARDAFELAKKNLTDYKGENKAMLQNEIAIALSVAKNEFSIKELEKEKSATVSATGANSNANSGSTANNNVNK